ncbi:MAG: hypothetical protein ABGY96_18725, partial [bacterium]
MLLLDGVYVVDSECPVFRRMVVPRPKALERLVQVISQRVGAYLEREGLLVRNIDNTPLQLEDVFPIPLDKIFRCSPAVFCNGDFLVLTSWYEGKSADKFVTVPHTAQIDVSPGAQLHHTKDGFQITGAGTYAAVSINESAAIIWDLCVRGYSFNQIVVYLVKSMPDVDTEQITQSVADCLWKYFELELLRWQGISIGHQTFSCPKAIEGFPSDKAQRLVRYCLGMFANQPIPRCSMDLDYPCIKGPSTLLLQIVSGSARLVTRTRKHRDVPIDQKWILNAWITQRSYLPEGLSCWIVRGDAAGEWTNPGQGVHMGMVRKPRHQHIVLAPSSDRDRVLGVLLEQQMGDMEELWTPWERKLDGVFWGGAGTGPPLARSPKERLTRAQVIDYFHQNPSPGVQVHPVEFSERWLPAPYVAYGKFRKQDAFRYKCLLVLDGNDIASGFTWSFCGNSVI